MPHYCPTGESISITAEFENHSRRTIIPHATLYQTQTFLASGKSRSRRFKFTIVTGLAIQARRTANWDAQLLKIPAVSPSIINCCLIKVEYAVRITLQIPLIAYNLSVDLPIVVGTVPLRPQSSNNQFSDPLTRPSEARLTFYPPVPPYSSLDIDDFSTTRKCGPTFVENGLWVTIIWQLRPLIPNALAVRSTSATTKTETLLATPDSRLCMLMFITLVQHCLRPPIPRSVPSHSDGDHWPLVTPLIECHNRWIRTQTDRIDSASDVCCEPIFARNVRVLRLESNFGRNQMKSIFQTTYSSAKVSDYTTEREFDWHVVCDISSIVDIEWQIITH